MSRSVTLCMSSWMGVVVDDQRPLFDVTFPGTHNSATQQISTVVAGGWARCQEYDVTQQMEMGVRMLDLRIADNIAASGGAKEEKHECGPTICDTRVAASGSASLEINADPPYLARVEELEQYATHKLWITHRFRSCLLRPVLSEIAAFAAAHRSEIFVLRIERDADRKLSAFGLRSLRWLLLDVFGEKRIAKVTPDIRVGQLRREDRRIVLCTKESFFQELKTDYKCAVALPRTAGAKRKLLIPTGQQKQEEDVPCNGRATSHFRSSSAPITAPIPAGVAQYSAAPGSTSIEDVKYLTPITTSGDEQSPGRIGSSRPGRAYGNSLVTPPLPVTAPVSNRKSKLLCDCEVSQWFLQWLTVAVPSWSWTRARKGQLVHKKVCEFLEKPTLSTFLAEGKFFVLEAILTHEADSIARHPFSSIKAANASMASDWLPQILEAVAGCRDVINVVTCDFVTPVFCKQVVLLNRRPAAGAPPAAVLAA